MAQRLPSTASRSDSDSRRLSICERFAKEPLNPGFGAQRQIYGDGMGSIREPDSGLCANRSFSTCWAWQKNRLTSRRNDKKQAASHAYILEEINQLTHIKRCADSGPEFMCHELRCAVSSRPYGGQRLVKFPGVDQKPYFDRISTLSETDFSWLTVGMHFDSKPA
jgi:hypothetical protein